MNAHPGDYSHYEQRRLKWIEVCRQFPQVEKSVGQDLVRSWVYHSNALSGSPVDHATSDAIVDGKLSAGEVPENDCWEVKDHHAAILAALQLAGGDARLDEAMARRLHGLATEHHHPRPTPEKGQSRFPYPHGVAVPPHRGGRYADFAAWESFVSSEAFSRFHPLKQAARVHHALLDLSPFPSGTGKVARLLCNVLLVRHGYPAAVLKEDNATTYYYCSRRSARLMVAMIGGAVDESFELYYQQIPAKFRPYETRAMDYPADLGSRKRSRSEHRTAAASEPPAAPPAGPPA